ncbi:MAG: hypothetical protein AAGU27_24875 [Dehalobacterium sp.]
MDKVKLIQGTLPWEKARETRIGSSEVFDVVRYYATPDELQNCGISAEKMMEEEPYTSAWALYHKMRRDGLYHREALAPEYAEYGHAVEPYGVYVLQKGRRNKLRPGEVYASDRLIASLDIAGVSEACDCIPYDVGYGTATEGKRFVCEQKSMHPDRYKAGLPIKYIIQAQYQAAMVSADFFILQVMVLHNDTVFERGKVAQMTVAQRRKYLQENMDVHHIYFRYSEALAALIRVCLERFFSDVDGEREPTPFLALDSAKNIISSIRSNTYFDSEGTVFLDLSAYVEAKDRLEQADRDRRQFLQAIIEAAKEHNAVKFLGPDGMSASFSRDGKFLVKPPKEARDAKD